MTSMKQILGPDESSEPSYVDYEAFLAPDFSPAAYANDLVVSTNNPQDSPLDLSTPLSRVLFDAQEVDSRIDALTTRNAVPLLEFTISQNQASKRIISELDTQLKSLNDSYKQLEREVIDKHAEADEVRHVALRLWESLRLGRSVGRCLQLGRHLEVQHSELNASDAAKMDHRALVRCSYTIVSLREVLDSKGPDEEGHGLDKVHNIRALQDSVITPLERSVRETAERVVRDFSVPANMTFSQGQDARAKLESAITALYLLSPTPPLTTSGTKHERWTPQLLLAALDTFIRLSLQASITALSRSLGQLPSLDRALAEVTLRCQNVIALEIILQENKPPNHPLLLPPPSTAASATHKHPASLVQPLLAYLETGSLASYFWRTMAGSLATRVQDIAHRGGVVARTLRSNKANVGDAIRQAVLTGSQPPTVFTTGKKKDKAAEMNWDREIAVMVGSVTNNLK
ncbi:hypothetical protein E4U31_001218 [Claviceps sp. LM219 group G6]|nr:hypothetical protein E4U31_001218 [Claviceps sp. LM219 group G6]